MTRPVWVRSAAVVALLVQLSPLVSAPLCIDAGRAPSDSCEQMGTMERSVTVSVSPAQDCHPAHCPLMGSCAPPVAACRALGGGLQIALVTTLVSDVGAQLAPVSFDPGPISPPPQS